MDNPNVPIVVLPGGMMPARQTEGAVGFDVYIRAIVDSDTNQWDPEYPYLRKTRFDFKKIPQDNYAWNVRQISGENGGTELVYRMEPGESVLVGLGFITEMPFPMFYDVRPRGGLTAKGIVITNAASPVDPDYRGESGIMIENRSKDFFVLFAFQTT